MISKPAPGAEGRAAREDALACLNHLIAEALTLAPSCLRYMERLHDKDIFKFCAIPQMMAIATLGQLANNPLVFTGVVKIRKGQALVLMKDAGSMTNVHLTFLAYARSIRAAIPPHHKAAYALAAQATSEIEEACLRALPNGALALASSPFFSMRAMGLVLVALVALLAHLYERSRSAGWGDGAVSYMPRITDSWDVAAVVGVVFCVGYLFAVGGTPLALAKGGSGSGLTPPSSPTNAGKAKQVAAADKAPGSGSAGRRRAAVKA
jgi:hypothetical protein